MLDENLPTYHFQASSENPLHTLLYFTYQGSEPHAEYLLKRPSPAESHNQYAFGLFDVQYSHVLYAEILLRPEWSQPTLSAAELRAQHGANAQQPPATALTPYGFTLDLYNPDQSVAIKQEKGSWGRSDAWEFEVPERSFRTPSASKVDQESGQDTVPELTPKVMFRWKRDSRLSKDMTCYMSGRSIGGKKNKEPDITVALFRQAKHESNVTIYEPNMARVDVEDRKGLEVILLLTAEIIRDLYLMPRSDPFNTVGAPPPTAQQLAHGRRGSSPLHATSNGGSSTAAPAVMSGANHHSSSAHTNKPLPSAQPSDAEARRLQEVFAREEREARERRDREEQQRIKRMLEEEEARERQRRQAEVDAETERLRREYGVGPDGSGRERSGSTPSLPPRPGGGGLSPPPPAASGANGGGGWFSGPVRPTSAGPSGPSQGVHFAPPPTNEESGKHSKRPGPYQLGSSAAATMSGFFGRSDNGEKKKVKKKRSVHF